MMANGVSTTPSATAQSPASNPIGQTYSPPMYSANGPAWWPYAQPVQHGWGYPINPAFGSQSPFPNQLFGLSSVVQDPRMGWQTLAYEPRLAQAIPLYDPISGVPIAVLDPQLGLQVLPHDPRMGLSNIGFDPRMGLQSGGFIDPRLSSLMGGVDRRFDPQLNPFFQGWGWPNGRAAFGELAYDPRFAFVGQTYDPRFAFGGQYDPRFGFPGFHPGLRRSLSAGLLAAERPGVLPSDEQIEEMIHSLLDQDPMIPLDTNIEVKCDAGQVSISGTVADKRIKRAAGEDAWWIPGVIDVSNSITVSGRRQAQARRRRGQQAAPTGR